MLKPLGAPRRFRTLDALRGVGALAIVAFHIGERPTARYFGSHFYEGYLAVDLFYVLSGVVLAEAYARRLAVDLSPAAFLKLRLVRFYPLYWVATLLAVALRAADILWGGKALGWTWGALAQTFGLSLLMLPTPFTVLTYPLFPAWTLVYELAVNALWAWARPWLRPAVLAALVGLAALGLLVWGREDGLDRGMCWGLGQLELGTARAVYSFGLGLLIHSLDKSWVPRLSPWVAVLIAAGVLCAEPSQAFRPWFDLLAALLVLPACVLLGTVSEPSRVWERRAFAWVGDLSYGVYVLHLQVILLAVWAARVLPGLGGPLLGSGVMASVLALAAWLDRAWDRPARGWLGRLGAR